MLFISYFSVVGIEVVSQQGFEKDDTAYCAGDGVKFSLPAPDNNMEGVTIKETDQSLEELMSQMKSM